MVIINFIYQDSKNLKKINDAFTTLDEDHTGFIEIEKLQKHLPELSSLQVDHGALMEYSDFLARAIDVKKDLSKQALVQAFKHFDPNNTGKITPDGLKQVLEK